MKTLSLITLTAMLSLSACSTFKRDCCGGHKHHKQEMRECCKKKEKCCKEKKACCKPVEGKECKDGHCPKPEAKKKA